jgi:hypothetical protein
MKLQLDQHWMKMHADDLQDAAELVGAANSNFLPAGSYLIQDGISRLSLNIPLAFPCPIGKCAGIRSDPGAAYSAAHPPEVKP